MSNGAGRSSAATAPLVKGGTKGNPVAVATKGAEKAALNSYGRTLVDRANNVREE